MSWLTGIRERLRAPGAESEIEGKLACGEPITLRLHEGVSLRVSLNNGVTALFTNEAPLPDDEARRLLYAAYAAANTPAVPRQRDRRSEPQPDEDGQHTIRAALTPGQNRHLANVLAAYFRLTSEE